MSAPLAESAYTQHCRMIVSYMAYSSYSITEDLETLNWRNRPKPVPQENFKQRYSTFFFGISYINDYA